MPMIEPVLTVFINMFKCRQPMFECPLPTNWYDYTQIEVMNTRARSAGLLKEEKVTNLSQIIFTNDAIHIWNLAWKDIKKLVSLYSARKAIKAFVSSVPIWKWKLNLLTLTWLGQCESHYEYCVIVTLKVAVNIVIIYWFAILNCGECPE